jgi:hypothetical protein
MDTMAIINQLMIHELVALFTLVCIALLAFETKMKERYMNRIRKIDQESFDNLRKRVSLLESEVQELERQNSLLCDAMNAWRRSSNDGK